jgi:hypothetical protein
MLFFRKMIAENAFSEMDVNQDGKVTEDEFVKAVLKHQVKIGHDHKCCHVLRMVYCFASDS